MNLCAQSIETRIDWLFSHAKKHGDAFASPDTWLARKRYLAEHPTAIGVLKCMDGRINIPLATETHMGIIQPFRNIGGRFDLGWPHLGEVLTDYVMSVVREGRRALMMSTYLFSKGDPNRGCAGFDFDTEAARAHTFAIRRQVEQVFGAGHQTVYPLVCGFVTDEGFLLLASEPYAEIGVDRARRTQVALPVRLRRRGHHPRVPAAGRENAPPDCRAELGQPESGIAQWRLSSLNRPLRPSDQHMARRLEITIDMLLDVRIDHRHGTLAFRAGKPRRGAEQAAGERALRVGLAALFTQMRAA